MNGNKIPNMLSHVVRKMNRNMIPNVISNMIQISFKNDFMTLKLTKIDINLVCDGLHRFRYPLCTIYYVKRSEFDQDDSK